MSHVKLGYTADCCRSKQEDRIVGERQRNWLLRTNFSPTLVGRFLQLSLEIACSLSTYEVLRLQTMSGYCADHVAVKFKNGIEAFLPNVWADDAEAAKAFLQLPKRFEVEVGKVIPQWPFRDQTLKELLISLEAVLPGHFSPLHISIAGGRFAAAQPTSTNLFGHNPKIYRNPRRPKAPVPKFVGKLLADLRGIRREEEGARVPGVFARAAAAAQTEDEKIYVSLVRAAYERTKIKFTSAEREAQGGAAYLARTLAGEEVTEARSPEIVAINFLRDLAPELVKDPVKRQKSKPRPFELSPPNGYFSLYGLLADAPESSSPLAQIVQRIFLDILMYCGRRGCCLVALTLGDFTLAADILSGERLIDLRIQYTKSQRQVPFSLPLAALLPEKELDMIESFLERTEHMPRETPLFSFVTEDNFSRNTVDLFASFLRSDLLPAGIDCFHFPRIVFVTNWPLRVMCATNRALLEVEGMERIRENVWFREDMLNKILAIIPGDEVDSFELCRRIVGHASTYECIADYCRSWELQMRLKKSSA